jgi:hypothetical protein
MAHLLNEQGESLGIADGLGVPQESWGLGDIMIQRHRFEIADSEGYDYWLRTGIYWLDTGERWQIETERGDAIFIKLKTND